MICFVNNEDDLKPAGLHPLDCRKHILRTQHCEVVNEVVHSKSSSLIGNELPDQVDFTIDHRLGKPRKGT